MNHNAENYIKSGHTYLGIELGSSRIKAVLTGEDGLPLVTASHAWENQLQDSVWVYSLEDVWSGIQKVYARLAAEVSERYGLTLTKIKTIGVSAMMHGYLAFDKEGRQLAPFRTWRNTITEEAAARLSAAFKFNIPQRWSVAHLLQALLNGEEHTARIDYLTTLAGYVHWQLTDQRVLGLGDASGMFPIDAETHDYDRGMLETFQELAGPLGFSTSLRDLLPKVLPAGARAGILTPAGALRIDPQGRLQAGIPFCPPEGDAATGMVATNSLLPGTGNVSAGTSIFSMVVLQRPLREHYLEIDVVATPTGRPVAMVHSNNGTSDLDEWLNLFASVLQTMGGEVNRDVLYSTMYNQALQAEKDAGGLLSYNLYAGEPILGTDEGRPLFTRPADRKLLLPNFMRSLLFSILATLRIGMDLLTEKEGVELQGFLGHGGFFRTPGVGQKLLASVLDVPVTVLESAGEGGPWGMALLAAYADQGAGQESLEGFLTTGVFSRIARLCVEPDEEDRRGFEQFLERYRAGIAVQQAAIEHL